MQGAGFVNRAEAWSKVVGRWDLVIRYILQIPQRIVSTTCIFRIKKNLRRHRMTIRWKRVGLKLNSC